MYEQRISADSSEQMLHATSGEQVLQLGLETST